MRGRGGGRGRGREKTRENSHSVEGGTHRALRTLPGFGGSLKGQQVSVGETNKTHRTGYSFLDL